MIVTVLGGGLAGAEATWQLARRGLHVRLVEMRPVRSTAIHRTSDLAELVCSNSLGADGSTPAGLLKNELRRFGSLIMEAADRFSVPAGKALAVDRARFAEFVSARLASMPEVTIERREAVELPDGPTILATGPLTSPALAEALGRLTGREALYFYDAVAPVVAADSLDLKVAYRKDRWVDGDGTTGDYLNCPMDKPEYLAFVEALVSAERHQLHDFEKPEYFEGCMPVEALAERGVGTLRFGPMRPVGLELPDGRRPYAVVQLRAETVARTAFNLVGFQTNLKWSEQARVLRMIPGLERAEFLRYGVMHRNIYVDAPRCLDGHLRTFGRADLFVAGQLAGVEGYVESCAMGLVAALGLWCHLRLTAQPIWPAETALGALTARLSGYGARRFQPVAINRGIFPPLVGVEELQDRMAKNRSLFERGHRALDDLLTTRPDLVCLRDQ